MTNTSILKKAVAIAAVVGAANAAPQASTTACQVAGDTAVPKEQFTSFHINCLANNLVGAVNAVAEGQQCADFMVSFAPAYYLFKIWQNTRANADVKYFQNVLCVNAENGNAIDDHGMSCPLLIDTGALPEPYNTYLKYVRDDVAVNFPVTLGGVPRSPDLVFPDASRLCGYLFKTYGGPDLNPGPLPPPPSDNTQATSTATPTPTASSNGASGNSASAAPGPNSPGSGSSGSSSSGTGDSAGSGSNAGSGSGTGTGTSSPGSATADQTLTATPPQKSGAAAGRFAVENCFIALASAMAFAALLL